MTSTTDPTIPLPTVINNDDDDDDDDVSSLLVSSQPPAATQSPVQPTVTPPVPVSARPPDYTAVPSSPGVAPVPTSSPILAPAGPSPSASAIISNGILPSTVTGLADNLPSNSPTTTNPTEPTDEGGGGISLGASAGIGVGVALIVCLAAFGAWFFTRRHRARRAKILSTSSHSSDEEHARKAQEPEVYAYFTGGPVEAPGNEKPRRWSELESPICVAEVGNGEGFRAELPGSVGPVAAVGKGTQDRLFSDSPIDEVEEPIDVQERTADKKGERLFSDLPIDEDTEAWDALPKLWEKKG